VGYDSDGCQEQITSTQKQQLPRKYYKTRSFNKGHHSQSPTTTTTTISDVRTDAANDHNNPSHNNSPRTFGNVIINNGTSTNIITSEDKIATGRVSSAARLQVRMVQFGNTFHFVPVSAEDASTVAVNALTSAECQELSISVLPGVLHGNLDKIHATHATSADNANNYVNGTTATHISHTAAIHNAVINPKHIYKTSCDTYRVQVGKGSKKEKNGKFIRNARSEIDALWLCELALIFLDCPPSLDDITRVGNYKCMRQRNMVYSTEDFAIKLLLQGELMQQRGLLKSEEHFKILTSLRFVLPASVLSMASNYLLNHSVQQLCIDTQTSSSSLSPSLYSETNSSFSSQSTNTTISSSTSMLPTQSFSTNNYLRNNQNDFVPNCNHINTINMTMLPNKGIVNNNLTDISASNCVSSSSKFINSNIIENNLICNTQTSHSKAGSKKRSRLII
jgi:hypothetical protein